MPLQQATFDFNASTIATGTQLKEAGIATAVDHANKLSDKWSDKAYMILLEFVAINGEAEFMTEDVRVYAEKQKGFTAPASSRAWGGPVVKAKNNGVIKYVGIRAVTNNKAHCANAAVWRGIS